PDGAREQRGVLFELGGSGAVELARTEALTESGVQGSAVRFATPDERFEPSFTVALPVSFCGTDSGRPVIAPSVTVQRVGVRLWVNLKLAAIERPHFPERSWFLADGAVSLSNSLSPNMNLTTTARARYNHPDDESFRTLEAKLTARLDTLFEEGLLLGLEGTV